VVDHQGLPYDPAKVIGSAASRVSTKSGESADGLSLGAMADPRGGAKARSGRLIPTSPS
jgi:hypothetical protein